MKPEELPEAWELLAETFPADEQAAGKGTAVRECARELREALRWVPVEERLPESNGAYLVWQEDSECQRYVIMADFWAPKASWSNPFADTYMNVMAWRPLPDGPEKR